MLNQLSNIVNSIKTVDITLAVVIVVGLGFIVLLLALSK